MNRFALVCRRTVPAATLLCALLWVLGVNPARGLDGGTPRVNTFSGWKAFEVITQGDDPSGDGFTHAMPGNFDGAGARLVGASTLRVQVNHEVEDASVSEVDLDLANLRVAINNVISNGNTGGVRFVISARQAYGRWSSNGGASFIATTNTSNTAFSRFCSGQAHAADTFGPDRGFVDPIYITGQEVASGRLFALDSIARDFYQLSGTVGSAPGGTGGMPVDSWENAALLDTGETQHIALLLSPDGGSFRMKLYVGDKGKDSSGNASSSFLARNGLAYGSWYYLNASMPTALGKPNSGTFDTTSAGALNSYKLEDIDTSPSDPTRVVLGDQDSGVFTFDFDLVFSGGFSAALSSFAFTKISNTSGSTGSLDSPDNVDWTAATTLGSIAYPEGLIFVNEDNGSGEIWRLKPDGTSKVRIAGTTVGAESTGIFDASALLGYAPGSILITNNQGTPASMTVLINPDAISTVASCGDLVCASSEDPLSCPQDCPDVCGDGLCSGTEGSTTCPADCGSLCGDAACNGAETNASCPADCAPQCIATGAGLGCTSATPCCTGVGHCSGGPAASRVCAPPGPVCGDGVVGGSEQCELGVPLTSSCVSLGFASGILVCNAGTCLYNTGGCVAACRPNTQACTVNADCCSTKCLSGLCLPR